MACRVKKGVGCLICNTIVMIVSMSVIVTFGTILGDYSASPWYNCTITEVGIDSKVDLIYIVRLDIKDKARQYPCSDAPELCAYLETHPNETFNTPCRYYWDEIIIGDDGVVSLVGEICLTIAIALFLCALLFIGIFVRCRCRRKSSG